jgi:competence protein ComEC
VASVLRTPLPDVLVAAAGDAVAVRTGNGRFAIVKAGHDAFVAREWLAADGDARSPTDKALSDGFSCDDAGCVARAADGALISFAHTPEAIAEDCSVAALVVTRRELPPGCAAQGIDRNAWRSQGAMALRRVGGGWEIEAARPVGYDRPWARPNVQASAVQASAVPTSTAQAGAAPSASATVTQPARSGSRDAQPRPEDLDAGD